MFTYRYIPSRLVKFSEMGDYQWKYVECPPSLVKNMGGVPVSRHEFGVIVTDRYVLDRYLESAGLRRWTKEDEQK